MKHVTFARIDVSRVVSHMITSPAPPVTAGRGLSQKGNGLGGGGGARKMWRDGKTWEVRRESQAGEKDADEKGR